MILSLAPLSVLVIIKEGTFLLPLGSSSEPEPSSSFSIPKLDRVVFPRRKMPTTSLDQTLALGYLVVDHVNGEDIRRFLIADLIAFDGN